MTNASAIRDLLSMLHEEFKVMLEDMIDRMEDNLSMDDMR